MKRFLISATLLIGLLFFAMPVNAVETGEAKINDTDYTTLQEAWTAARAITTDDADHPTVITILRDCTAGFTTRFNLDEGDYITIQSENANDIKTITMSPRSNNIKNGATFTLQNITIDGGAIWQVNEGTEETPIWQDVSGPNVPNAVNNGLKSDLTEFFDIEEGGTLTIGENASIMNLEIDMSSGVCLNNGTLIIDGGTITNNKIYTGGLITNRGTCTINSGLIYGNFSDHAIIHNDYQKNTYTDEVIYIGILNLNGGTISGNKSFNYGAISNDGTLNLSGGTITGNTSYYSFSAAGIFSYNTINLSGSPIIEKNYPEGIWDDDNLIFVEGEIAEESNLGVSSENSNNIFMVGPLTANAYIGIKYMQGDSANQHEEFAIITAGEDYHITTADFNYLHVDPLNKSTYTLTLNDDTVFMTPNYEAFILGTYYATLQEAWNVAKSVTTDDATYPTVITILRDCTVGSTTHFNLDEGDHILIQSSDSNDIKTITMSPRSNDIKNGATFTLQNITIDGGAIWQVNKGTEKTPIWQDVSGPNVSNAVNNGLKSDHYEFFNIKEGGTLTINKNASIINMAIESSEGLCCNQGTLNIDGGMIAKNAFSSGAIIDNQGTTTINDCQIYGNACNLGTIDNKSNGTLNLKGGDIFGNSSYNYSAINNQGIFNFSGGTITGNTCEYKIDRAGIFNQKTINLSGSPIIEKNYPQGVWDDNKQIFIKGEIAEESNLGIPIEYEGNNIYIVEDLSISAHISIKIIKKENYEIPEEKLAIITRGEKYHIYSDVLNQLFVDESANEIYTLSLRDKKIFLAEINDIPSSIWYRIYVKDLVSKGILNGYKNSDNSYSFKPESTITRAEFATILAKASGEDLSEYENKASFNDVSTSYWGAKFIEWAYQNDIVEGTGDGKYDPDANISRQEMAVMIYRFATIYQGTTLPENNAALSFTDQSSIETWATDAVNAMQRANIINGMENTNGSYRFEPNGDATRAQAAKMISVYLSL